MLIPIAVLIRKGGIKSPRYLSVLTAMKISTFRFFAKEASFSENDPMVRAIDRLYLMPDIFTYSHL